jgi:hypothetical protein
MDDEHSNNTSIAATQASFTSLPLYQQSYVTGLVLGPAAAIRLAQRNGVDFVKYDWWRVQLKPRARRALEGEARRAQIERTREMCATISARRRVSPYARVPRRKSTWERPR